MDLATAWKSFRGIVRDAQEAIHVLHGYFRESTGRWIPGIVGSESLPSVWEQTHPLDRNDKKELLSLLAKLESSLSHQNTSAIVKGLRPILPPADKVESDIGPCLDRLRSVMHGFADDLIRDAADGDLCFRVCPRYLRLREALDPMTLLEEGYATSRTLEQVFAGESSETPRPRKGSRYELWEFLKARGATKATGNDAKLAGEFSKIHPHGKKVTAKTIRDVRSYQKKRQRNQNDKTRR